jgi:hypothetical protein
VPAINSFAAAWCIQHGTVIPLWLMRADRQISPTANPSGTEQGGTFHESSKYPYHLAVEKYRYRIFVFINATSSFPSGIYF